MNIHFYPLHLYGKKRNGQFPSLFNSVNTIFHICRYHKARCGIKTGYRIDDHEFTGMTTSHSDAIRIFYLLLSIILRNIWTLLKAVQTEKGMSEMRAYEFSEELKKDVFTAYISS